MVTGHSEAKLSFLCLSLFIPCTPTAIFITVFAIKSTDHQLLPVIGNVCVSMTFLCKYALLVSLSECLLTTQGMYSMSSLKEKIIEMLHCFSFFFFTSPLPAYSCFVPSAFPDT